MQHFASSFLKFKTSILLKRAFFLLNTAIAMTILEFNYTCTFATMLPKNFKYSTFSSCFCLFMICTGECCLEILITLVCKARIETESTSLRGCWQVLNPTYFPMYFVWCSEYFVWC
jgi:hypothetical protein